MSKPCPIYGKAIYADCLECEEKLCKEKPNKYKYKQVIIGIDQSYSNTGISIAADGKLIKVKSKRLENYKNNSDKRRALTKTLDGLLSSVTLKSDSVVCIIERIRLRSQGFLNIDYIKSIGALNAVIVDVMSRYNVPVYSVDTRCWKSQVIGTSKPEENEFGVPPEKWPTVNWCIHKGFKNELMIKITGRKTKGIWIDSGGQKWQYNNDAADSAGIAMFWFKGDREKLKIER